MRRQLSVALTSVVAAMVLGGCGLIRPTGSPPPAEPPAEAPTGHGVSQGQPDDASDGSQTGAGQPAATKQPPTKQVSWAPNFGPISQTAPPGHRWYQQVEDQQCSQLQDLVDNIGAGAGQLDKDLYGGLAKACKGSWPDAVSAMTAIKPEDLVDSDGNTDCLMMSTYDTLKRLVDAHQSQPGVVVRISGRADATCQPPAGVLAGPDESPAP